MDTWFKDKKEEEGGGCLGPQGLTSLHRMKARLSDLEAEVVPVESSAAASANAVLSPGLAAVYLCPQPPLLPAPLLLAAAANPCK
jgi:hypothetical protein